MLQFRRKVRLSFSGGFIVNPGGFNKHDLKVAFSLTKDISSAVNSGTVEIWNLTESHRNSIGKEYDEVVIEAGYMPPDGESNVGIIGRIDVKDVEHTRDGADIITRISCGEGHKALARATTSKSWPKGTLVKDVIEDIYKELEKEGIKRGEWKFPEDMPAEFKRPYAACGSCRRELDMIGRGHGFYWSVQNGVMEIVPGDGYVGTMVSLDPNSGMIDVPTITDNGIRVACLINPEIRPNRRIQVRSQVLEMNAANGVYRVGACTFAGDNRDGEFRCDITAESIQGDGKVDQGKSKRKKK